MSAADILSDPTYPHGTTKGFADGCRGAHCPAPMRCREVHFRYHGDYAFKKALDSGMTVAQVLEQEGRAVIDQSAAPAGAKLPVTDYQKRVWDLVVNKGYTDRQVADAVHRTRDQAAAARKSLHLPANLANRTPATAGVSSSQGAS